MPVACIFEPRDLSSAGLHGKLAARVKGASGRQVDRVRDVAGDGAESLLVKSFSINPRPAVEKADRIRHPRALEKVRYSRPLHGATRLHHDDAVGDLGDHAEIVRNE